MDQVVLWILSALAFHDTDLGYIRVLWGWGGWLSNSLEAIIGFCPISQTKGSIEKAAQVLLPLAQKQTLKVERPSPPRATNMIWDQHLHLAPPAAPSGLYTE